MNERFIYLSNRVFDELTKIDLAIQRAFNAWQDFQTSGNEFFLDSVALSLQGAYNGLEVIFDLIAREVDEARPRGNNWHQVLLVQMAAEVEGKRPAVISSESYAALDDFRGFRHLVRHIYPFELKDNRIAQVMDMVAPVFGQVRAELTAFAMFLKVAAEQ